MIQVPTRHPDESDLDYLRRKEKAFGLWQSDALEALNDNERVIAELRLENQRMQAAINLARDSLSTAQGVILPFAELELVPDLKPARKRKAA